MISRLRPRTRSRHGSLLLLAIALMAALAGCAQPGGEDTPAGRLAFLGADGNVYVTTPGTAEPLQITHDATVSAEGEGLSYHRLAWSPSGALAFAAVERRGSRARGRLYVVDAGDGAAGPPRLMAENPEHFYIYVYWSPAGRGRLAYLIAEEDGVGLHLVDLERDPPADRLLATGRPFYLSWAPDGQRIAWHAGSDLAIYDLETNQAHPIAVPSPAFRAPAWSPDPRAPARWLALVSSPAAAGPDHLTAFSDSSLTPILPLSGAQIAFSWSPGGAHVAYAQRSRPDDPFYNPIHLLTPQFPESPTPQSPNSLTPTPFRPLAFFWSPAGDRLAYLSWLDLPNVTWAQWRVVDVTTGEDRGYAAFRPSPLMQFALHSFDQYAQSHRFWSPDGRYLVYAARDERGLDRIWLVDTRAAADTDPIYVADGPLAYWSFH